ncbi:hypothetical protein PRZ48_006746 [Zasmidium cellare]|uniref:LysM domain-containing protein n=1 Tax=Zasmidium cellare TaxID=395010 RepID=A0ABR0ER67_ZASCE|nr:hypothetical protein PRZ48_006746 [Zasmidium cellare]
MFSRLCSPAALAAFVFISASFAQDPSAPCPASCQDTGSLSTNWTIYHELGPVQSCGTQNPVILDFHLHNAIDNPNTHNTIFACEGPTSDHIADNNPAFDMSQSFVAPFNLFRKGLNNSSKPDDVAEILRTLQSMLSEQSAANRTGTIGYLNGTALGVYVGTMVPNPAFATIVVSEFISEILENGMADMVLADYCDGADTGTDMAIFAVAQDPSLSVIQSGLAQKSLGGCIASATGESSWLNLTIPKLAQAKADVIGGQIEPSHGRISDYIGRLFERSTDNPLYKRIDHSNVDTTPYGQQMNPCATHVVAQGETCDKMPLDDSVPKDPAHWNIDTLNENTWGFNGCQDLQVGQIICVGIGYPPLPQPIMNAVCGPQLPNTQVPSNISTPGVFETLNKCQDGAPVGQKNCISNCADASSPPPSVCDATAKYNSLDDIVNDPNIPKDCINQYLLSVLNITMSQALDDFHRIMDHGYSDQFNLYKSTVRDSAQGQFDKFVKDGKLPQYFTCAYSVPNDNKKTFHNETGDCPPNQPADVKDKHPSYNTYYLVKDHDVFCRDLLNDYGVDCSWMDWETNTPNQWCFGDDCQNYGNTYGPNYDDWKFNLADPGDLIQRSLTNYSELRDWLEETTTEFIFDIALESSSDVVDGVTIPVFTLQEAVSQMSSVVGAAQSIQQKKDDEAKKNLTINIASAVLLILPGIGEVADAAVGVSAFARMATVIADAGNVALGVYDVVNDPANAPLAIASILLGGALAARDGSAWLKAATARRAMNQDAVMKLGTAISTNLGKVDRVKLLKPGC